MADDDTPKVAGLVTKSFLAAGGVVAALATPWALIAAAVVPDLAQFMGEKVVPGRLEKFFSEFARSDESFDDIEAHLHAELLTDPHLAQTVWYAVRAVLEVLDDNVVPSLGALAAEYRQQAKPADSFFRGMTGMLSGLSGEEFVALKDLVAACDRFEKDDDPLRVHANSHTGRIEISHSNIGWEDVGGVSQHSEMLFQQMKAHGIGAETSTGGFGSQSGPLFLSIRRVTVQRLVRILADCHESRKY